MPVQQEKDFLSQEVFCSIQAILLLHWHASGFDYTILIQNDFLGRVPPRFLSEVVLDKNNIL